MDTISSEDAQNKSCEELFKEVESSLDGLDSAEASRRLNQFGSNALEDVKESILSKLSH